MKKMLSIIFAGAFSLALVSCGTSNDGMRNRVGLNNGTGRRISQQNITGVRNNYRDGVYVGYGNARGGTNEMAVVEVRNGRIIDIDLVSLDQQGYNNAISNMGGTGTRMSSQGTIIGGTTNNTNTTRNSGTTGITGTTGTGTRLNSGITGTTTPNTTTGNNNNNQTIRNYNNAMGGNTNGNTNNIARNNNGIGGGTGTTTGTGTNMGIGTNGTGTAVGTAGNILDQARTSLISTMLRRQSYDVTYTNNSTAMSGTIDNWKLAVQRALAQARV